MTYKKEEKITKINPPTMESTPIKFWKNEDGRYKAALSNDASSSDITEMIKSVVGVKDGDLALQIFQSGISAHGSTGEEIRNWNVILQALHDIGPKDAVEARLALQAGALFANGMSSLGRAEKADMLGHSEHYTNRAIKLLRLHNETIEALSRYRRDGEQKVTVVHVAEKMAVVNNYGGGGNTKNEGGSPCNTRNAAPSVEEHAQVSHVETMPLPGQEDVGCTAEKVLAQRQKKAVNA